MNKNEISEINWSYIKWMGLMLIPLLFAILFFKEIYNKLLSLQFLVILFGTIFMEGFLIFRLKDKPKINELYPNAARLYFSATINVMLAAFAAFGIAFSIIWGNLYTYTFQKAGLEKYVENLRGQSIVLLLFILVSTISVLICFLLPLLNRINEYEMTSIEQQGAKKNE